MYQYKGLEDTIVAICTPFGQGGIGIVRLSGQEAVKIADKMFLSKNKKRPSQFKNFMVHYGYVVSKNGINLKGQIIDEALLTVMRAPRSYTKENIVEISCHGGVMPLRCILNLSIDYGARLAEPGEFTKRAFLNGRIDLTQAEAVLDIVQAKTEAFMRVSTHQLKGELTLELEVIREGLMNIYTKLEAFVNFPEDTIGAEGKNEIVKQIIYLEEKVSQLLRTSEQGRILKEGIKIVLCGSPNVGKSSLLNCLLKQPRAIVSPIPGTTRDTIEESAQIKGIPFQLVDTAGILEPRDLIEQEAIHRSRLYIQQADLILLIVDGGQKISQQEEKLISLIKDQNVLIVINKCDLPIQLREDEIQRILPNHKTIFVSALKKIGIDQLEEGIVENVLKGQGIDSQGILISNVRHIQSLKNCIKAIHRSKEILIQGVSLEFVSEEIKTAINDLDSITGRNIDADLLDRIFSQFCIGK